jgi:Arc/MetJ-type ribon-helix-helix transcriptional regulator
MPISVRLSNEDQKRLDAVILKGHYKDRSDAIRDALSLLAQRLDSEANERVTISIARADLERLRRARIFE